MRPSSLNPEGLVVCALSVIDAGNEPASAETSGVADCCASVNERIVFWEKSDPDVLAATPTATCETLRLAEALSSEVCGLLVNAA